MCGHERSLHGLTGVFGRSFFCNWSAWAIACRGKYWALGFELYICPLVGVIWMSALLCFSSRPLMRPFQFFTSNPLLPLPLSYTIRFFGYSYYPTSVGLFYHYCVPSNQRGPIFRLCFGPHTHKHSIFLDQGAASVRRFSLAPSFGNPSRVALGDLAVWLGIGSLRQKLPTRPQQ